jgi:pimeloyl-ACP methyl ester carboxylesterase
MIRHGFLDTPRGQLHFRDAGRGRAVLLLHWTPGWSAQYDATIEAFASHGLRAIALDLPGLGLSHRREGLWSIADFANSVLAALDWLLPLAGAPGATAAERGPLPRCTIVGGHLSAEIAIECALRAPHRFELVVLDGTPAWDAQLRRSILDKATPAPMTVREDGSHLAELWKHVVWETRMWRPNAPWDESLGRFAMGLLRAKVLADFDMRPAHALAAYDVLGALDRLRLIARPASSAADRPQVLALTADDDPLRNCHDAVLARVPAATGHCFPGEHPIHVPERAAEYAAPILARLAEPAT